MTNPTDTNQASEDVVDSILSTLRIVDRKSGNRPNQIQVVKQIIRTEKLKLLAEVRERVIGENDRGTITDPDSPSYGEPYESAMADKDEQRAELDKLEAEL